MFSSDPPLVRCRNPRLVMTVVGRRAHFAPINVRRISFFSQLLMGDRDCRHYRQTRTRSLPEASDFLRSGCGSRLSCCGFVFDKRLGIIVIRTPFLPSGVASMSGFRDLVSPSDEHNLAFNGPIVG